MLQHKNASTIFKAIEEKRKGQSLSSFISYDQGINFIRRDGLINWNQRNKTSSWKERTFQFLEFTITNML